MVTLEFISLLQTYFLVRDQTFYNEELQIGCEVQSSNLHEELGQIDTVFTDKTGTLTKNEMGIKFVDRDFKDGSINLLINGSPHCIKLKAVIEFSSERKCMSVLVEHQNR